MTKPEEGHFSQKHRGDTVDERIAQGIRARVAEGGLSCAVAFIIAADLSVMPVEVGRNADLMEIPIMKCQLGLFGYGPQKRIVKPAESITPELEKAIQEKAVNGRVSCAAVFSLAEKFNLPKIVISSACEAMRIKINSCQLGAF